MPSLLIVEDEAKLLRLLARAFEDQAQWQVRCVDSAESGLDSANESCPDVVLTDLRLPGMSGLDLMAALKKTESPPKVVVMTAYATVGSAVEALRSGAVDYLIKPFPNEELMHVMGRIENEIRLATENAALRERLEVYEGPSGLVGSSEAMAKLRRLIAKAAPTQSTVLIRGESGTGKELIARAIHEASGRSALPLVRVNCGAIPENLLESELFGHVKGAFTGATERRVGRFEMAGEGTLFLDEISELPPPLQVKLLRVLQEREYEPVGSSQTKMTRARIIAASNRDLEEATQNGKFREDLFYRLNVVNLVAPPLREHLEDLEDLVEHFVRRVAHREGFPLKAATPEFLAALRKWRWPGNVRELENTIEAALIMGEGDSLESNDLPGYIRAGFGQDLSRGVTDSTGVGEIDLAHATLDDVERHLLMKALHESGGNQSEAARRLGITRRTLGYRREKYGI
ncbi:MAG: sigma-54-dependent Fis family transcriptional regulator [Candidatus Omnitrophica bacterium]|nr:sigma-54-dependent Fis family transcriptional regulator [Candidatus Omnitrophota bacterium]